ncbi:hypothetical protein RND81_12G017600 [Saponaria officinalis]|uniref:Uncharacterized protein n=1 Tax=Saponaria officinalis TaxID=3572 RepID=A0AAW1H5Z9_SAPOF
MKPERMYLDELNTNTKAYKVKVKVIEKGRAKTSPKKGVIYQNLLLEDDKGNKMRGALFGDQVEGYKEAFVYNGVYEIANAPIKPCSEQWKSNSNELNYQMTFRRQTIIQAVNTESGPILPEYQCISQIPKAGNPDDKFDVLGIVLYIEEKARKINISKEHENLVREIVITDHSTEQPMIISTWNDLAENDCDVLSSWAKKFSVVGFTALRVSTHKVSPLHQVCQLQ